MSVINPIRNIILTELRYSNKELREGLVNVLNAIDNDLNIEGYSPSEDVENAILSLDNILISQDTLPIPEEKEETIILDNKRETPDIGYRDLIDEA